MSVSDEFLDAASGERDDNDSAASANLSSSPQPMEKPGKQKGASVAQHVGHPPGTCGDQSITASVSPMSLIPVSTAKTSSRPTLVEVFTGQAIDVLDEVFQAQETTDKLITELRKAQKQTNELLNKNVAEHLEQLERIKASIEAALGTYQWTPGKIWLYQWSLVILLFLCALIEAVFVEFYCRWHGASFISLDLYSPVNVDVLSKIGFVNGPTTMSIAAEVLMWSSLGVWAQQSYANTKAMLERKFRFAQDGPQYIGIMMRNTSVAAIIVILLRLSNFSLFGVSLEASNPMAFDATIGLSFLLGFFGDDAYRILFGFKNRLVSGIAGTKKDNMA